MDIKKLVVLAKNNDEEAKKIVLKHYEPIFINNVKKYHSNVNEDTIKEVYMYLIDWYLKSNYNMFLQEFLYAKARSFGHSREMMIGSKVDIKDNDKSNFVINHYCKIFFNKIKNYNNILTEEELKEFSKGFIKKLLNHKSESNNDIRVIMTSYIATELKFYEKNIENLYKRYILCVGLNDKIINYFCEKNKCLLETLKQNPKQMLKYNYLITRYRKVVINTLNNLSRMNCNVSSLINRNLKKEYMNYKLNEQPNVNEKTKDKIDLFEKYSYVKEIIYNKFENKIAYGNERLKKEIDEKYNDYLEAYLNGNSSSTISKYLSTRLTDYFNRQKSKALLDKIEYKDEEYYLYISYIEKYLKKLDTNFPYECAKDILTNTYNEIYKKYIFNNKKSNVVASIQIKFKKIIDNLNINYNDKNIFLMKEYYKKIIKENRIIDESKVDQIMDNLTNYYLSLKMDNNKPYEIFIIQNINNFDYKKYEEIENIKEQIKIKK